MTRDTVLTFQNTTQSIAEWALDYGILPTVIIARIERGLSIEDAITIPMVVAPRQRLPEVDRPQRSLPKQLQVASAFHAIGDELLTLKQWADRAGLKYGTLMRRLRSGDTLQEAVTRPLRKWGGEGSEVDALKGTGARSDQKEVGKIEIFQEAAE